MLLTSERASKKHQVFPQAALSQLLDNHTHTHTRLPLALDGVTAHSPSNLWYSVICTVHVQD